VRITGTAADPDGAPTQARVAVQGGATTTIAVAGGAFQTDITGLPAGAVRLCVTVVDVASPSGVVATTGDRALPCSSAVVGGAIGVGTSGSPTSVTPVGPAPSSPLAGIDRDAGISVRLRDGSVLWVFGDSSAVDANGDVRYFVNNTAAWAAPGALTTTRDAAPGGLPVQFATPTGAFPACPPEAPVKAMWPMSAVAEPQGARDRVVVMMYNVCLGGPTTFAPRGVSVVEWYYDQTAPPDGTPIRGTVLNQVLFNENEPTWGTAATIGGDGLLYTYSCAGPVRGGWPDEYGPCKVARVAPGSVATRSAWTYWAGGSTWSANPAAAVALTLPDGVDGKRVPVASMTVTFDTAQGVYVMAYSPWPGYTDRIQVRVATGPTGPWTAPVEVVLPGCEDTVAGVDFHCYAGTAQPSLSESGLLGLGYYDQLISVGPSRGQYVAVKVPFTVVLTSN
jgi:hypothetical protein